MKNINGEALVHIIDDPALWHKDWGTYLAYRMEPYMHLTPQAYASLLGDNPKDRQFGAIQHAAISKYVAHISRGGKESDWPGVYLCDPPAGMPFDVAQRIRKGKPTPKDLAAWRSLQPSSPYYGEFE
jgi:hypothetical protein